MVQLTEIQCLTALMRCMDDLEALSPPHRAVSMPVLAEALGLSPEEGKTLFYYLRGRNLIGISRWGNTVPLPYNYRNDHLYIKNRGMDILAGTVHGRAVPDLNRLRIEHLPLACPSRQRPLNTSAPNAIGQPTQGQPDTSDSASSSESLSGITAPQ